MNAWRTGFTKPLGGLAPPAPRRPPRSRAGGLLGASPLRPALVQCGLYLISRGKSTLVPTDSGLGSKTADQRKSSMAAVAPRETAAAVTPIATWPTLVATR